MGVLLKDSAILYSAANAHINHIDIDVDPSTIPASVSISPSSGTLPAVGGSTLQLSAVVLPDTAIDRSVTWHSSNNAVATVASNGLVTRVAPITSADGQPYSVTITATTVNNISTSVVLSAAVMPVPSGAFAMFDGIDGAQTASTTQWTDKSGNGRHMLLTDCIATDWENDECLNCGCHDRYLNGCIETNEFDITTGYTFAAVIEYDETAADYKRGEYTTGNKLDCIFALRLSGTGVRSQHGIGERNTTNANKLFDAVHDGNAWETQYTAAQTLTGRKIVEWSITGNSASIYLDGVLVQTFTHTNLLVNITPNIYFFAGYNVQLVVENGYNFFGKVYAVAVYNKVLTAEERTQLVNYYNERY